VEAISCLATAHHPDLAGVLIGSELNDGRHLILSSLNPYDDSVSPSSQLQGAIGLQGVISSRHGEGIKRLVPGSGICVHQMKELLSGTRWEQDRIRMGNRIERGEEETECSCLDIRVCDPRLYASGRLMSF
jgi:hypothetical protein